MEGIKGTEDIIISYVIFYVKISVLNFMGRKKHRNFKERDETIIRPKISFQKF